MKPALLVRWMLRESRGARGRLVFFTVCLAVGVAAVVGAAALSETIRDGFQARSRQILGADVTVESHRPLPNALGEALAKTPGIVRTDVVETTTMASAPGKDGEVAASALALLFAVEGEYPLYGSLATRPPGGLDEHLGPDAVVVEQALLDDLDLTVGDEVQVGAGRFRIAAVAEEGPGGFGFASFVGPRIYVSRDAFAATGLLTFGARVRYEAFLALPGRPSPEALDSFVDDLKKDVPESTWLDFDTHYDSGPASRRSFTRAERFIGLVALLSLLVGGIGVGRIVSAWLESRTRAMAILRCLGMRPGEILAFSLLHTGLLSFAGSVVGAGLGCLVPLVVRLAVPDLVPAGAPFAFPIFAVLRGLALGVGLGVVFALPPMTAIWRVPPSRVLRAEAEPLPASRLANLATGAALVLGILGAAWFQAGEVGPAIWFTGGFLLLAALLAAAARGLMALSRRLPRERLNPYLLHGVSALARPGAGTTGAIVALGLGTMVVTAMVLVETRLTRGILEQVPDDAPNAFFLDVKPDQWDGIRGDLVAAGATGIDQVPLVTARITAIDGTPIEELAKAAEDSDELSRRSLTREQRLTWREKLPPDNEIVEGKLWSDPDRPEVSVERRYAERLGVKLGSRIEFSVHGEKRELVVTSIRDVQWKSFSLNFFLVAEPGALDRAPALYLANARLPEGAQKDLQNRLAADFPNVTMIRVGPIVDRIVALLKRIAAGIGILGTFTVLAALAILSGAVSATAVRRGGEVALLKTLGVTRGGVMALFFTEYGLVGAVAGAIGSGGALLLAWAWLHYVAELDIGLPLLVFPLAIAGAAVLTGACGVAAGIRSLLVRPVAALR